MTGGNAGARQLRSPRWRWAASIEVAAVAGIVCAVTWSLGLRGLLERPGLDASPDEVVRFYADPDAGGPVGLLLALMIVGTVAYLWFVGVVRARLGQRESPLVGSVFLGGSVLLTGLILVGASALAAPSVLVDAAGRPPDPGAAAMFRSLAAIVLSVFTARVATVVMFSLATLARRARALPMWAVIATYVLAVAEFVNITLAEPRLYVFPAWIAFVSVLLLVRRPQVPPIPEAGPA